MAPEVTELAVGVTGEDFAAVAAEEFDGGFESIRCIHGVLGFGMAMKNEKLGRCFWSGASKPTNGTNCHLFIEL